MSFLGPRTLAAEFHMYLYMATFHLFCCTAYIGASAHPPG